MIAAITLILIVGLSALITRVASMALSKAINRMLRRYTDLDIQDYAAVLHLKVDYKISKKKIEPNDWVCHSTLQ